MTYYERKAQQIRDHCLAHPWTEDEWQMLVEMIREIALDQRHACAGAVAGVPPHGNIDDVNATNAHSAAMNAEIGS